MKGAPDAHESADLLLCCLAVANSVQKLAPPAFTEFSHDAAAAVEATDRPKALERLLDRPAAAVAATNRLTVLPGRQDDEDACGTGTLDCAQTASEKPQKVIDERRVFEFDEQAAAAR